MRGAWVAAWLSVVLCGALAFSAPPAAADPYHLQAANEIITSTLQVDDNSWIAQSFTAPTDFRITRVSLHVADESPSDVLAVSVRSSVGGWPAATALTQGSVDSGSTAVWVDIDLSPWVDLTAGTLYWIVPRSLLSNGYDWSRSSNEAAYLGGTGAESGDGLSWSASGRDYTFRVWGFPQSGLSFTASVSDANPQAGDAPVFRADVLNSGSGDAAVVWVNVTLPAPLTYVSDDAILWGGNRTGTYDYRFTNVAPDLLAFNLTASIPGGTPQGTVATTTYVFDSTDHNGVSQPRVTRVVPIVVRNALLTFSHTSSVSLAEPGDFVTYNATARNVGQETAGNVDIEGVLDPSVFFVSSSPGATYDSGTRTVRRTGLAVAAAAEASMEWTVRIPAGTPDGASVGSSSLATYDDVTGTAMPPETGSAPVTVRAPVFSVTLATDPADAEKNDVIWVTLAYNNTGSTSALAAWANWTTGANYALLSLTPAFPYATTGDGFDVALSNVVQGPHALVVRLRVLRGLNDGLSMPIQVRWHATDGNGNPLGSPTLTAPVDLRAPVFAINATAAAPRAGVDAPFVVTVTLRNEGRAAGSGWLNLTLPPDVDLVTDSGSFVVTESGNVVSWAIPSTAAGSEIVLAVTLRGGTAGPKSFRFAMDYTDEARSPAASVLSNAVSVELAGGFPWLWVLLGASALALPLGVVLLRRRGMIEEVFLVGDSGILLAHLSYTMKHDRDRDLVSGMLTAVQDFIKDSFVGSREGALRSLDFGQRKILIRRGTTSYLAVVLTGRAPSGLPRKMEETLRQFEERYPRAAEDADDAAMDGANEVLYRELLKR